MESIFGPILRSPNLRPKFVTQPHYLTFELILGPHVGTQLRDLKMGFYIENLTLGRGKGGSPKYVFGWNFKYLHQLLRHNIQSFRNSKLLPKNLKNVPKGARGSPPIFIMIEILLFCDLGAHVKFQYPSNLLSGRNVTASEEE